MCFSLPFLTVGCGSRQLGAPELGGCALISFRVLRPKIWQNEAHIGYQYLWRSRQTIPASLIHCALGKVFFHFKQLCYHNVFHMSPCHSKFILIKPMVCFLGSSFRASLCQRRVMPVSTNAFTGKEDDVMTSSFPI